jgi:hypothetical protein
METARYALSIATAPAQPEISNSSSILSFQRYARLPFAGRIVDGGLCVLFGKRLHCRRDQALPEHRFLSGRAGPSFAGRSSLHPLLAHLQQL